jgi:hypothetical protein
MFLDPAGLAQGEIGLQELHEVCYPEDPGCSSYLSRDSTGYHSRDIQRTPAVLLKSAHIY